MKEKSKLQRRQKYLLSDLPYHVRRRFLNVHLDKELRRKLNKRSILVRKGDEVKVLRGKFKGKMGKVLKVDYKKLRVYIEGCSRKNIRGEEKLVGIHPSKIMLIKLNLEDKRREEKLGIRS